MGTLATVKIVPPTGHTGDVVECLRGTIEKAIENKAVAVGVVMVYPDGGIGSAYSHADNFFALAGGVAELQYRLHSEKNDG